MALMDESRGQAYLQNPPRSRWDGFILDFDTANLTSQSFTQRSHQEDDPFCTALRSAPDGTKTRMILLQSSHFPLS
jgi:hypothetical protein